MPTTLPNDLKCSVLPPAAEKMQTVDHELLQTERR
jgi:hypothetical protein